MTLHAQFVTDWNARYQQQDTPWDDAQAAPEMIKLFTQYVTQPGRVIEIGCGTGSDGLWLAAQGHDYLGLDMAEVAIQQARQRAEHRGVHACFRVGDMMQSSFSDRAEVVYDRGCFHTYRDMQGRLAFAERVAELLPAGGLWITICGNADHQPKPGMDREPGWPRLHAMELVEAVEPRFAVRHLARCTYGSTPKMTTFMGWGCVLEKR